MAAFRFLSYLTVALTLLSAPAAAQQVFRCDEQGNAFYYRIGPGEFRNWVAAGNGYAARWLDNQCQASYSSCSWDNGVLWLESMDGEWAQEFDTNSSVYRYGATDDYPTIIQCTRASDPPPPY